jgi:zinc transporter, ZIP family
VGGLWRVTRGAPAAPFGVSNFGASAGWGLLVGATLVAGALMAVLLTLSPRAAALLAAFGGGVLLAAIALELVPEADELAGPGVTAAGIVAGTLIYVAGDVWLTRDDSMKAMRRSGHAAAAGKTMHVSHAEAARGEAIAAGLFIDGVPEAMALGLTVAEGSIGLALLAGILIGNVVEAYGASQPIIAGGHPPRFAVGLMSFIGVSLVVATILGGTLLTGVDPVIIGGAEAVAAGAVLAVVSVSVIPHAFAEVSSGVAIASMLGFVAGFLLS